MKILRLETNSQLRDGYECLQELRTGLTWENFQSIYYAAGACDGYTLWGLQEGDALWGVMGCRVLWDYVHGKHLYIDDLVITASERSRGLGAFLLEHAQALAAEQGCTGLRLCTGADNEAGKRFYERQGWHLRAVAFKKSVSVH